MKNPLAGSKVSLWTYYFVFILITIVALFAITFYSTGTFRDFFIEQLSLELEYGARYLAKPLSAEGALSSSGKNACETSLLRANTRVTIIDREGLVLCDSAADPKLMDNHRFRPEVKEALLGQKSLSMRYSKTVKADLLYVAVPVRVGTLANSKVVAVARVAVPLTAIDEYVWTVYYRLFAVELLIGALLACLSYVLYRRISSPLREMRFIAGRLSRGQFEKQLPDYQLREISDLALSMNKMGAQLERSEKIRRDFVANVSHELKTPITSIKGFVETLLDGAKSDPADSERFLNIIAKQAERLTMIIEDLLTLARLESEGGDKLLYSQEEPVLDIISAVTDECTTRAAEKNIDLNVDCDTKLTAEVDRPLIEHALMNLVDNAIKYSGSNSVVRVSARPLNEKIEISVCDEGPGISEEHLHRLFERFYRADKARSRHMGGTGLGLAIVKHVASVHRGSVTVESEVGYGSTFSIFVPRHQR